MPDFEQDIIRRVRIETQVDTDAIKKSSMTLDNFYKKYQSKEMKVDTSDFFKAVDAVRTLRKELDTTKKNSPHMEGIIGQMSGELEKVGQQFERVMVRFTNGDIANGLDEAVNKITQGLAIQAVDLGDYLSTVQEHVKKTVDTLKSIGAIDGLDGKKFINLYNLDTKQLENTIELMQTLKEKQKELDSFNGQPLKPQDLYSNITTDFLSVNLKRASEDLEELKQLNLNTVRELYDRREIIDNIYRESGGKYDEWDFEDIKEAAKQDKSQYDIALSNLQQYVSERQRILSQLQDNSYLFTNGEFQDYSYMLNDNIDSAKSQIQELQQLGGKGGISPIGGNFTEVTKILGEIKESLQTISDVFKNEDAAMRDMAKNGVTSFTSLSQAIIEVYNNLTQVQSLVDNISQKDFNITNITQTGGENNNIQGMKQQMMVARETMEHLRQLYDQASETLELLSRSGNINEVVNHARQLQEFSLTDINKSVKGANTEMKLASVVVEMQDYIDKLTQINELRNKYNLGEWKDTFVPTQKPISKPVVQSKTETTVAPTITQSQEIISSTETDRLREFVNIINNEISVALDNIKEKFAQSFVVPELDKNNLQTSFDEIYNKFIELKDKIGTMKIDVGINTANITTAIQEALYAKEIAANYKKVEFEDVFDSDFYNGTWKNRYTGEVFDTFDAVDKEFDEVFKNLFTSKDGWFMGTKDEMLADFLDRQSTISEPEQENWAQVIVEAINTQGGNIVQAIKLMLPKNISEGIENGQIDEAKISDAFQTLSDFIANWSTNNGNRPGDLFYQMLSSGQVPGDGKIHDAFSTLGMVSDFGEITFTMPDTGLRNLGVAISDQVVATIQDKYNSPNTSELMKKLDEASALGASVPRILSLAEKSVSDGFFGTDSAIFQLQTRSPGVNTHSNAAHNEFLGASDEQIDRLIHTFEVMSKVGLYPDFVGDNILFDNKKGFSLVDLETENIHDQSMETPEQMVKAFLANLFRGANEYVNYEDESNFKDLVMSRLNLPPEKRLVNANTIATEQATISQIKSESKASEVKIAPTMDDGAIAKLIDENVAKTPATVKVTPVIDSASQTEQAVDGETQSAIDAAKSFVDAANAKKQFVEANKQVAESAKESTKAVKEEAKAAEEAKQTMTVVADDTELLTDWDKEVKLQSDHKSSPFAERRSKTENNGDESVRTIVESWTAIKDEDGKLTGKMELNTVQIINDFKKRTDAITKESEKIKTAQAYLQKFLTQFDNKTMGEGKKLKGYEDLLNLSKSDNFNIDDIAKAEQMMSNLDAEYNTVVQKMRKGSSSMNPFVNAINGMDKMEDVLKGISLQFKTLNQQPEWLKNQIIDLYKQLDSVSAETDIYKFAEGFGNLKVSINSVVETIRQQRTEQKLALSDFNALVKATKTRDANTEKAAKEEDGSAWKTYYTDRATEQQRIIDTIRIGLTLTDAQEVQLNAMAEKHALILSDITRENNKIEEQKQKYEEIMRLLEKNHTDQIELDNDTLLDNNDRSTYQQILNQERAKIEALIANTDLNPDQTKSVNNFVKSIENDRIAKVKEYIDLLKLQQDYEKKAKKEDDGSNMQSFYNEQIEKVKEKIKNINIKDIANQEEKNKLLALEETHQRAIAEIIEKKNSRKKDPVSLFSTENKNIENKYEAGYLNKDSYMNWKKELAEYRDYMSGVTKADETTIQHKKQSLLQMYDMLTKMSNASKSFFASGGEILPKEMWFDEAKLTNVSKSLNDLYGNIVSERFEGMKTSITGVNENLGKLNFTVDDGKGSLSQYTIVLNKATGATKLLSNTTKPTLTIFQKFGQTLKKDFTGILHATMGGTGVYAFVRYMRQGIEAVRELDLALTELKKVTDETEETYDRFLDTASKTSARIGKTITEMTSATAEFAKLGYDIEQASSMAESALVYANVGDNVDVETGSQSIISTLKAFGIEANNTMSIVDKFNEVGNNFAITTKGIGDALQVSASAMAAAGNSLDETIALTTAANTIVQNPNTVGTALKTLSLRIRGVKTELEEAGLETEGMAETTSQLQAKLLALTDGKVNIMVDKNNFKNTTQILREMAAEWENLTDVEQAAALELLGGKRQANTLAAILTNFDIVEDAIEASSNSAGSALEENAKVLDSIQGRINLFNNALQTMWNNALDSDLIKDIVNLGIEIVKIVDKVGLLNSVLLTLGTFKGLKYLSESLGISSIISDTLKATNALELLDAETRKVTLTLATEGLQTKLAGSALVEYAVKMGLATAADVAKMTTTQLLGLSFKALGTAIVGATKAMVSFLFTNPIGWFILATAAVAGGVAIFNHFHKTTEELTEELSNLKSELSDIRSEMNSLNSELETTQSRIAELLAMDNLSFTEQEELNNLQKQNDELQRQIDLIELKNKQKEKETAQKFTETMRSDVNDNSEYYGDGSEVSFWSELGFIMSGQQETKYSEASIINKKIKEYQKYADELSDIEQQIIDVGGEGTDEGEALKKEKDRINSRMSEIQTYINGKTTQWNENSEGLEYFTGDNLEDWQKDTNAWLNYINDIQDQWAIASGGTDAKTNAITRIFNKEEFLEVSDTIDGLVEKLEKDPTNNSIRNQIQSIIESNSELVSNLERVGLSADKATDYFTMLASSTAFDTISGKMEEISRASEKFEQLVNGTEFAIDGINIDLQSLFDEEGKIDQIKLSSIFTNTSDEMRKDITSILEGAYDDIEKGTVKIEDLLTKFSLRTTEQFLRVQNNFISNQNKEWFPGLEDEISGIIDTFDELATAIGSIVGAMDTLEQARKEEEYSGSVSIETLAKLMEYTDDYSKIVSIDETGAIHLAADAQNILIQEKINAIRTNAEAAVQEATLAYQNALAAESSVKFADVIAGSTIPQLDQLAGAIAYAGSILGDLEAAMADGFGGVTFSARNSMAKAETAYSSKISSRQSVRTQATSDAEEALRKAQDNLKIANGITADNVQSRYSSSVADGSSKSGSDDKDDAFQKAMDYWENRISANQAKYEQIQNEIDLLEKQGKTAGEDYYKKQIELENERLKLLEGQRAEAKKYLGTFKEGSEEWWEVASTLNDIEGEIDGVTASLQDLSDAIAQIKWDVFDESHTRFGNLKSQLETVRELVAPNNEEDWFDDEGMWTDKGVAVAGAYIQEIEIDENALEDTQKKLADFAKGYKGNEKYFKNTYGIDSEQEYYDKRQELLEQEQEYAKNINSNKQAVIDMYEAQIDAVEEYTNKLIDSYNEYIDTVKEALDTERDLYEFKKDIAKQTKDIAQIERRIASLSGSDNAADIAERRKLEAELAEAKEGLNDSYYAHSKDALQNALEEEANAYEETMNKFIEGLRESLDEALLNMDLFMEGVYNSVITNAPSILEQYNSLELALDSAIINPWEEATAAITKFGGVDGLGVMNSWINEGGIFPTFKTSATDALKSPWEAGKTALGSFKTSVDTEMKNIVRTIESNVSSAKGQLNSLTSSIQDTNKQAPTTSSSSSSGSSGGGYSSGGSNASIKALQEILNEVFGANIAEDGIWGPKTEAALKKAQNAMCVATGNNYSFCNRDGKYTTKTASAMKKFLEATGQQYANSGRPGDYQRYINYSKRVPVAFHAKGTLGTKRDEFAITDESWIGEEITLAAGKNGQLQYLKKGSAVMPADISANLVEWGKLNPNMLNIANPSAGINLMTNYVSKPELNLSFEALVKAGTITQEALPAVKELVQQELNKFTKQLNYSIKRIGAN